MHFDRLGYLVLEQVIFLPWCFERKELKFDACYLRVYLRKQPAFKTSFSVPQMLAMMVDLEEDEDWANIDEVEDDDCDR